MPTTKASRIKSARGTPRSELRITTATIEIAATKPTRKTSVGTLSPVRPAATRRRWPSKTTAAYAAMTIAQKTQPTASE
jgi:hypothetical protein